MGYFLSEAPGHEGYAVGFVDKGLDHRANGRAGAGLLRELGYPADDCRYAVEKISAGCDCGWRSPRWIPTPGTTWSPFSVATSEFDDDRVVKLWTAHVHAEIAAETRPALKAVR